MPIQAPSAVERSDDPHAEVEEPHAFPSVNVDRVSLRTSEHLEMMVWNNCQDPVDLVWVDWNGEEQPRQTIRPGARYLQGTYLNHVWVLRTAGGVIRRIAARQDGDIVACPERSLSSMGPFGGLCSAFGTEPLEMHINNPCSVAAQIFWISQTCERRPYGTIAAHGTRQQSTFVGHVWEINGRRVVGEPSLTLECPPSAPSAPI